MDAFDGILMVPPDRGQILGRAVWKSRYVVVGRRTIASREHQSSPSYSQLMTTSRIQGFAHKDLAKSQTDTWCLFVHKSKDEWDTAQQWPLASITDCQVQTVAHRKQGPVLPTLIVTIADKERKRRSSRTAGLISGNKDCGSTTLWFRTPPDDHHHSLHDWARFIWSKKGGGNPDSPTSPFINPFASRSRDASDHSPRPDSDNPNGRSLQHKSSSATYSTGPRERPLTFSSASPSLRSKRSDVSSPSSFSYPHQQPMPLNIPGQQYTTVLPTDLTSPFTAGSQIGGEPIDRWTSGQGAASTVSSPARGRDSMSSHAPQTSVTDSSSPPAPRETILDRAFQLRYIPGSEREVPGEEKLSSLARFDALMRDADARRRQRVAAERAEQLVMRSAFEADDSSEEDDNDTLDLDDTDSDDDNYVHEQSARGDPSLIHPTAKRALDFIADRSEPLSPASSRPSMARAALSFHADATPALTHAPPLRPHTANAKSRTVGGGGGAHPRVQSVSQLRPSANLEVAATLEDGNSILRPGPEKRQSSPSAKRLSFTEFTKRLSSTSSLLLVQTNVSSGSSRGSSEADNSGNNNNYGNNLSTPAGARASFNPRGPVPPPRPRRDDVQEAKCGWRGSVGVMGSEGGFL